MRIEIHTPSPALLWDNIKRDINNNTLQTWSVVYANQNEEFLTHSPGQWFNKALLQPSSANNPSRLIFTVTWYTNSVPDEYTRGLFIGRFTEVLLAHYKSSFSKLETFA